MKDETKSNLLARLRRIKGQIGGVRRMAEDGRKCQDIITQLVAIRSAVDSLGLVVLDAQLRVRMKDADGSNIDSLNALEKAVKVWSRSG